MKLATFAMGCFWHPQRVFDNLKGIEKTEVGFMGGKDIPKLTYEQVCSGTTGHAEVIQITFNPKVISYEELLKVFWKEHDPTTKNRQGLDFGVQYRSVIFYHTKEQKQKAEESKKEEQKKLKKEIVTEIKKAIKFYKAEEYHQKYFEKQKKKKFGLF